MSKLVDGNIPAGTPCPFQHICPMKFERCPTDEHLKKGDFSCASARAYDTSKKKHV